MNNTYSQSADAADQKHLRYVVIEGCIGVGKTTLCTLLAKQFGSNTLFEKVEENPFLADFYKDQETNAFKTQTFFLLSRYKQQLALKQQDLFAQSVVADYFMIKDRIFAELTLSSSEFRLYEQLYQTLGDQICVPDLVIHLRAPLFVIEERIKKRGREFEKNIDKTYLSRLIDAYDQAFSSFSQCPVLTIDTEDFNFPDSAADVESVKDAIFETLTHNWATHSLRRGEATQPSLF